MTNPSDQSPLGPIRLDNPVPIHLKSESYQRERVNKLRATANRFEIKQSGYFQPGAASWHYVKLPKPYTITQDTVLDFEVEIHDSQDTKIVALGLTKFEYVDAYDLSVYHAHNGTGTGEPMPSKWPLEQDYPNLHERLPSGAYKDGGYYATTRPYLAMTKIFGESWDTTTPAREITKTFDPNKSGTENMARFFKPGRVVRSKIGPGDQWMDVLPYQGHQMIAKPGFQKMRIPARWLYPCWDFRGAGGEHRFNGGNRDDMGTKEKEFNMASYLDPRILPWYRMLPGIDTEVDCLMLMAVDGVIINEPDGGLTVVFGNEESDYRDKDYGEMLVSWKNFYLRENKTSLDFLIDRSPERVAAGDFLGDLAFSSRGPLTDLRDWQINNQHFYHGTAKTRDDSQTIIHTPWKYDPDQVLLKGGYFNYQQEARKGPGDRFEENRLTNFWHQQNAITGDTPFKTDTGGNGSLERAHNEPVIPGPPLLRNTLSTALAIPIKSTPVSRIRSVSFTYWACVKMNDPLFSFPRLLGIGIGNSDTLQNTKYLGGRVFPVMANGYPWWDQYNDEPKAIHAGASEADNVVCVNPFDFADQPGPLFRRDYLFRPATGSDDQDWLDYIYCEPTARFIGYGEKLRVLPRKWENKPGWNMFLQDGWNYSGNRPDKLRFNMADPEGDYDRVLGSYRPGHIIITKKFTVAIAEDYEAGTADGMPPVDDVSWITVVYQSADRDLSEVDGDGQMPERLSAAGSRQSAHISDEWRWPIYKISENPFLSHCKPDMNPGDVTNPEAMTAANQVALHGAVWEYLSDIELDIAPE